MKLLYTLIILFAFSFAEVISVTGFRNNTSNSEFDWLGEALADNISSDLSKIKSLTIVNRRELKKVIDEQKFSYTSGLVDIETSVELGEMLGATKLVTGNFTVINRTLRLNLNYIDIETGVTEKSLSKSGELDKILYFQNALVLELLEKLNIKTDEIEKMEISNFETNNIEAVENNYKGVIAFDRKKLNEAIGYFEKAIEIDPYYRMANEKLKESNKLFFIEGEILKNNINGMIELAKYQNSALEKVIDKFKKMDYCKPELDSYEITKIDLETKKVTIKLNILLNLQENYFTEFNNQYNSILTESDVLRGLDATQSINSSLLPKRLIDKFKLIENKSLRLIKGDFYKNNIEFSLGDFIYELFLRHYTVNFISSDKSIIYTFTQPITLDGEFFYLQQNGFGYWDELATISIRLDADLIEKLEVIELLPANK